MMADEDIELYHGDDYDGTEALSLTKTGYDRYDLTNATGTFRLLTRAKYERGDDTTADLELSGSDCTIAQNGTTVTVTVTFQATDFVGLLTSPPKPDHYYRYQVTATTSGGKEVALLDGDCTIKKKVEAT